jgi:hypothetical protein
MVADDGGISSGPLREMREEKRGRGGGGWSFLEGKGEVMS